MLPQQIKSTEERIAGYEQDVALFMHVHASEKYSNDDSRFSGMTIKDYTYTERHTAGAALLEACKGMTSPDPQEAGSYMGFFPYGYPLIASAKSTRRRCAAHWAIRLR